jgi:hypothetical protein
VGIPKSNKSVFGDEAVAHGQRAFFIKVVFHGDVSDYIRSLDVLKCSVVPTGAQFVQVVHVVVFELKSLVNEVEDYPWVYFLPVSYAVIGVIEIVRLFQNDGARCRHADIRGRE